jgi:uncharacterized integral membrane protein
MTRVLSLTFIFVTAVVVIILAIANRGTVTLSLDPFAATAPALALELPLYLVLFAGVVIGLIMGGLAAWISGRKMRSLLRQRGKALLAEARGDYRS